MPHSGSDRPPKGDPQQEGGREPQAEGPSGPGGWSGTDPQSREGETRQDAAKGPTLRTQRLKLAWFLALPLFLLARPSPGFLLSGGLIASLGLLLRGVAAGSIHKDRELARGGLYGHLRHPLYLGSFLVGTGISMASGIWWIVPVFIVLFVWMYGRTIVAEEREVRLRFGTQYQAYREHVPAFIPRIRRRTEPPSGAGFRFRLYRRNKEWQAALGVGAAFILLGLKMILLG